MMEFGVRPQPNKHEDIYGYLMRVMHLNGITTPSSLKCDELSLYYLDSNFGSWSEKDLNKHLNGLSTLTGLSKNRLNTLWKKAHPTWTFNQHREIRSLKTAKPRICVSCLLESLSFNKEWSNITYTACDMHSEKLIHECTECKVPFSWNTAIFQECPTCNVKWDDLDPHERSLKPCAAEQKFKNLHEHERNKASDSFAKCLIRAVRPFDIEPLQVSEVPLTALSSEVVRNGYQLWSNSAARDEQRRYFEEHWMPISPLVAKQYQELGNPYLYSKDIKEPIYLFESGNNETDKALRPAIQKLITKDQPSHTIVSPNIFAKTLGIDKQDLPALSKCKQVKTIRKTTVVRDTLYDVRSAEKLINSIASYSEHTSIDLIEVRPGDSVFDRHLTRYGFLLADIILGKVKGYRCSESLKCIVLDKTQFYDWLAEQFEANCKGNISLTKAKKVGGRLFKDNSLESLLYSGDIKYIQGQKDKVEVDGVSLYQFITTH